MFFDFSGVGKALMIFMVIFMVLGLISIPSNTKPKETIIYIVDDVKYSCPSGYKLDSNLTCVKTRKSKRLN